MPETNLLSGLSGFIARRIALAVRRRGPCVKGTRRSPDRADEVRAARRPRLPDPAAPDRLSLAATDPERDEGRPVRS